MQKQWVDVLKMMVGLVLEFDRCIMPITTGGQSVLAALKKHKTYGGKCFTFQELETALKRAAYILNSWPMSALCCRKGGVDPDFIRALTPNMLLLGRANCDAPLKSYEASETPLDMLHYIAEIESWFGTNSRFKTSTAWCPLRSGEYRSGTFGRETLSSSCTRGSPSQQSLRSEE